MLNKPSQGARSLKRLVRQCVWVVESDDWVLEHNYFYPTAYTTRAAAEKRAARLQLRAEQSGETSVAYRVHELTIAGAMPNTQLSERGEDKR